MRVTVGICTWNRCRLLQQALEQMTELTIPPDVGWELLVVNNNCTDETDSVVESYAKRLPIRPLFQPTQGKSHALNLAVTEARGDYILWTDDDVLVDKNWLAEYCCAFKRWPDAAVFGGTIEPLFASPPPPWLVRGLPYVESAYAIRTLKNDGAVPIAIDSVPYGANMAIRRIEQTKYLYDTNLGPRPDSKMVNEETTLIRKMLKEGATGWWVPKARVQHYIPKQRQTTAYLREYFLWQGEFGAQELSRQKHTMLFGKPRWLWRSLVENQIRYCLRRLLGKPEAWVQDLRAVSTVRGMLRAYGRRTRAN